MIKSKNVVFTEKMGSQFWLLFAPDYQKYLFSFNLTTLFVFWKKKKKKKDKEKEILYSDKLTLIPEKIEENDRKKKNSLLTHYFFRK